MAANMAAISDFTKIQIYCCSKRVGDVDPGGVVYLLWGEGTVHLV